MNTFQNSAVAATQVGGQCCGHKEVGVTAQEI